MAQAAVRLGPFMLGGAGAPPLIVAELSGNHQGSLTQALALIDAAADAGAQAVKLQTYTPDTMTLNSPRAEFRIDNPHSPWHQRTLYDLYQEAATPWDWHPILLARCAERGLLGFSSPFDFSAVEFLESLNVPCYKMASFENTHLPLIERVAATGKPLILSTGMATAEELDEAVAAARGAGCEQLILLKCTSAYPAPCRDSHLLTLADMRARYQCPVGLSDHTPGLGVAVAATALGACLIEKHLTLARADAAIDSEFSLEPKELAQLVLETGRAAEALGSVHYGPTPADYPSLAHRRSIYVVRDLQPGDVLDADTVRVIRPAQGIAPKFLPRVIGREVRCAIAAGTPLAWDLLVGPEDGEGG